MPALTYPEAIVVGLFQGVSELFPVSSLGHSVLIPALIGGQWARDLNVSAPESPYLAFIVGLHVATALALLVYFWRDWLRIVGGFVTSLRDRQVRTADQRLAWLIILATIPVGIAGLLLEHTFRTVLGKPIPAAIFLTVNGVILYAGERLRRRRSRPRRRHRRRPQAARQMAAVSASQPAAAPACGNSPRATTPTASDEPRPTAPPTGGWPASATSRPCSSAPCRSSPCSPASAAPGSPWSPACPAACPTRTPRGSRSCSPPRSSSPPARSRSPT